MRPPLFQKMSQNHLAIGILEGKISKKYNEDKNKTAMRLEKLRDDILNSASVVHFYFKERGIVQYSREQLYSIMDVIGKNFETPLFFLSKLYKPIFVAAAFGGVIGLCMGFSLLSGVELIYWFTLRLFIDQFRKKK